MRDTTMRDTTNDAGRTPTRRLTVWVGDAGADLGVAAQSAIVSSAVSGEACVCHVEGNLYGAVNMVTWADRVLHAAGRAVTGYPTASVRAIRRADLVPVGEWDDERGVVVLDPSKRRAAAAWLGVTDEDLDAECQTTCSARHEAHRALEALEATPQGRMQAAWLRRSGPAPYRD
jgi:hypothetical protein